MDEDKWLQFFYLWAVALNLEFVNTWKIVVNIPQRCLGGKIALFYVLP